MPRARLARLWRFVRPVAPAIDNPTLPAWILRAWAWIRLGLCALAAGFAFAVLGSMYQPVIHAQFLGGCITHCHIPPAQCISR